MRTLIVSSPRNPLHICVGFPDDRSFSLRVEHAKTGAALGVWRFEDIASVTNHDYRILRLRSNRVLFTDFVNFAIRRGCSCDMVSEALKRALHIIHIEWEMLSRNPFHHDWDEIQYEWKELGERRSGEAP